MPFLLIGAFGLFFYLNPDVVASIKEKIVGGDPDMPEFLETNPEISKEEYMLRRAENIGMLRGVTKDQPFDPALRLSAISKMQEQEAQLARTAAPQSAWTEIGPNPIPNGQTSGTTTPVSGRTLAIAVHPTDPNIVYVGTAQGGLYRTTDGGTTWTPLLDSAQSLAVNTVAIVPSQPETIFVGTGEAGFCGDCYFGAGIYRIDNASTTANLTGPFGAATTFSGRSVSKIVMHPTNPNIMFVTSASGSGGIGGVATTGLAARGVFRSTDALSATPTFTKMTITGVAAQDRAFVDMVMDPGNPDLVLVTEADSFALNEGGVYRSTDAVTAVSPTFVRTFTAGNGTTNSRTELALHRDSGTGVVTVYAASGFNGGTVQRSIDGGATWTQRIDNNFCTAQCFYDIAVAVDPTNVNRLYLGGSPTLTFGFSINGGTSFTASTNGLHSDSHTIAVAPSLPSTLYFGSDGGIYKSTDSGVSWTPLNNTTFRATQFTSIAVHPTDPNFTIGGTQDNGTNFYKPDGTWTRADAGDGGYTVIDQNAADTTNVRMYHTYFNQTNAMAYARTLTTATAVDNGWTLHGCGFAGSIANGFTCAASAILFYAPMEQGPGSPLNTLYFGSDVLYRSADGGTTMTKVSQEPIQLGAAISAIAISPQNDNVRMVGENNGNLFGTTTGASPLVNLDPSNVIPNSFIGRIAISPTDANTAYVALAAFGVTNLWKTTTLSSFADTGKLPEGANLVPTWVPANNGLPQVPVNGLVIDPLDSNRLYAGTDIGVYVSHDSGANWIPFGTGLPRVAVFDLAITGEPSATRKVRIATHGRGMWQIQALVPSAANVSVSGRVMANGRGVSRANVTITDAQGNPRRAITNAFGYYRFDEVSVGQTYVIEAASKKYTFAPQVVFVENDMNVDFAPVDAVLIDVPIKGDR